MGLRLRRISGTVNGVTTVYPFPHYEIEGTTVRKYYFLGGQRVAVRNGGALSYLLTDHLGSTSVSVDASGSITGRSGYLPFGGARYATGDLPTPYRFTGQHFDPTTGLMWIGSRWYDPLTGRWSQPDTLIPQPGNPQALNRYSWVLNRPLSAVDPTGHVPEPSCAGIPDCQVDGWQGYGEWHARKTLDAQRLAEAKQMLEFLANAVSVFFEPADYVVTAGYCLAGNCSTLALAAMITPGVPGAVGRHADEAADVAKRLDKDLFAFGNRSGPRPPRPNKDVFPDVDGVLAPQTLPEKMGASTFTDPNQAPLNGYYHRFPAGSELPSGLDVVADGLDVDRASHHPATHRTIFNTVEMTFDHFVELFTSLAWQYGGKK